ncbi:MAG: KpsF/GutQ family sugar-phosphate isomerase [Pseudomonadota bacterium]
MAADRQQRIAQAQRVLRIEADAVAALAARIDDAFETACQLCLACTGRIVVTGMGKSGHVAGKIAATLASTGSPAFFLHPGEASHGDLGMITDNDVVLAISYSGETQEVLTILPLIKRLGAPLISMTGNPNSTLAKRADAHLNVQISEEACPLNLAPTASTTATLALGDALAVALLDSREFTAEDFARSHPGGSLGKRLLLRVEDIMHVGGDVPLVAESANLSDALLVMSRTGLGMATVVTPSGKLAGIFTDGDLRRLIETEMDLRTVPIAEVMTRGCKTIGSDALAAEAVHMLDTNAITGLPVTDSQGIVIGALNIHDLFRAGVV